jgi:hypothetical protein
MIMGCSAAKRARIAGSALGARAELLVSVAATAKCEGISVWRHVLQPLRCTYEQLKRALEQHRVTDSSNCAAC